MLFPMGSGLQLLFDGRVHQLHVRLLGERVRWQSSALLYRVLV